MDNLKNKIQHGSILPLAMIMAMVGLGVVYGYYSWMSNKKYQLRYRIAKTKAFYNAETGMAEKGYPYLFQGDFQANTKITGREISKEMGYYEDPSVFFYPNGQRAARVTGVCEIINTEGEKIPVKATIELPAELQTLGVYMYLTESEKAGGAPFVFDSPSQRRAVNFTSGEQLQGVIQTNETLTISAFGCPDFSEATVYLTNSQAINLGGCGSYNSLFGGEVDTMSKPPVTLPPKGYETLKSNATHVYDASIKINQAQLKDTLIMTDIQFFDDRTFRVRQWWYLMPPHFVAGVPMSDLSIGNPLYLEGADLNGNGVIDEPTECLNDGDLRTCVAYEDSLKAFHAKSVNTSGGDMLLNSTIYGPHGFHHFDFEPIGTINGNPNPNALLLDIFENGSDNTVIYVKGGAVRVKGVYNGRYTIVTDEHTVYRRHATRFLFGGNELVPRDTIWNNIWLTGDLINKDAYPYGSMQNYQPDDDCEYGSKHVMGLVSGANIIVANTPSNRPTIIINAGLIALNESFVIQYWQNTVSSNCGAADGQIVNCSSPPYGDGRGIEKYGSTGSNDNRGTIIFWGGMVQKYRGYLVRNNPGPYANMSPGVYIGYTKNYKYDANLDCSPPPFYPAIEFDNGTGEVNIRLADYKKVRDN